MGPHHGRRRFHTVLPAGCDGLLQFRQLFARQAVDGFGQVRGDIARDGPVLQLLQMGVNVADGGVVGLQVFFVASQQEAALARLGILQRGQQIRQPGEDLLIPHKRLVGRRNPQAHPIDQQGGGQRDHRHGDEEVCQPDRAQVFRCLHRSLRCRPHTDNPTKCGRVRFVPIVQQHIKAASLPLPVTNSLATHQVYPGVSRS